MKCCFDKRAWIGLGVLAAGLLIVNPRAGWVALPVLAGLACPVSMLFMMRGMRPGTGSASAPASEPEADGDRAAEIARLRREIRQLRAQAGGVPRAAADADPAAGARDAVATAGPAGGG